jgi:hypothetical protein
MLNTIPVIMNAGLCRTLPAFAAPKGQEKADVSRRSVGSRLQVAGDGPAVTGPATPTLIEAAAETHVDALTGLGPGPLCVKLNREFASILFWRGTGWSSMRSRKW